jgi:hypothetical protein
VLVDLQRAIDDPSWATDGPRNNLDAEVNVAALLAAWRRDRRAIYHVKHDGTFATSTYRPGQPGNEFKPEAMPRPGETVLAARARQSVRIGSGLEWSKL